MDKKEFKNTFNDVAKKYGFEKSFGGWFKESPECIIVLDLQKSNFSDLYYLNIKIYIQGLFGNKYVKSKELVKNNMGDVFRRQPKDYSTFFDFDSSIADSKRIQGIETLFHEFLQPFTNKGLSKIGVKELATDKEILLLPAVEKGLMMLI